MLRYAIWDFDGTLCNTYPAMCRTMQETLKDMGIAYPYRGILALMQVSMRHAIQMLAEEHNMPSDRLAAAYAERHRAVPPESMPPFACVPEALELFLRRGGANYVMTHRGESAIALLSHFGLEPLFQEIVTGENGFPRKPAPDANEYLLSKWGLDPSETVMIGDRELDIESGKSAGIYAWLFAPEGAPKDTRADWVFGSYREVLSKLDIPERI